MFAFVLKSQYSRTHFGQVVQNNVRTFYFFYFFLSCEFSYCFHTSGIQQEGLWYQDVPLLLNTQTMYFLIPTYMLLVCIIGTVFILGQSLHLNQIYTDTPSWLFISKLVLIRTSALRYKSYKFPCDFSDYKKIKINLNAVPHQPDLNYY